MKRVALALGILLALVAVSVAVVGTFFWLPSLLWGERGVQYGLAAYGVVVLGAGVYTIACEATRP
jgi:hypothetical protein